MIVVMPNGRASNEPSPDEDGRGRGAAAEMVLLRRNAGPHEGPPPLERRGTGRRGRAWGGMSSR